MIEVDFIRLGFVLMGDGTLRAPSGQRRHARARAGLLLHRIILLVGAVATCIIHRAALKITQKEAKPWA
jgi:hypothetical protein